MQQIIALKALRDLIAANKGIRRLKAKLKQYEEKNEGDPLRSTD
jgi:hypothetical protein